MKKDESLSQLRRCLAAREERSSCSAVRLGSAPHLHQHLPRHTWVQCLHTRSPTDIIWNKKRAVKQLAHLCHWNKHHGCGPKKNHFVSSTAPSKAPALHSRSTWMLTAQVQNFIWTERLISARPLWQGFIWSTGLCIGTKQPCISHCDYII